ncbi:MAG: hypothetical protein Q8916_08295 [Bacteroidota bacterium]|nr:hypothetical protein [Bacteroidota bacterium]
MAKVKKKRSILKKLLLAFAGLILLLGIGAWIFFTYYFDDFVDARINSKLQEATRTATHGLFRLVIGKVKYSAGSLYCTKVEMIRARYDSSESGLTMKQLTADSVSFKGLEIFDILRGKGLFMKRLQSNSANILMTDVAEGRKELAGLPQDTIPIDTMMPVDLPAISYDSIILSGISVTIPKQFAPAGIRGSYDGIRLVISGFRLDDTTLHGPPLFVCKGIDLAMHSFPFDLADSSYVIDAVGAHVSVRDSLVTLDTFSFRSKLSEGEFAAKHRFATPMLAFSASGIRVEGIDFNSAFSHNSIDFRRLVVDSFYLDSYEDRRRPPNPHPTAVMFPNELISSFQGAINGGSIALGRGDIRLRERSKDGAGELGFENVRITIAPIRKDSTHKSKRIPAVITLEALFLKAPLDATITYPLDQKRFDMDVHATLGSFDAHRLNPWLVPMERIKVRDGVLRSGKIDMKVRNGIATTAVLPIYNEFGIEVLSASAGSKPGFTETIKTFISKTFIIRANNPNGFGSTKTGVTTRKRLPDDQLFQFLWFAIRKSLGQVVGGFQ